MGPRTRNLGSADELAYSCRQSKFDGGVTLDRLDRCNSTS